MHSLVCTSCQCPGPACVRTRYSSQRMVGQYVEVFDRRCSF